MSDPRLARPLLFARLNAECPGVPSVPELHGPLAWITVEWGKAAKAPGRPRGLERQLFLASWLFALARPRLVMEHGEHLSELWIRESSGKPRRLFPQVSSGNTLQPPRSQVLPPIVTLSGAIEVLTGSNLKHAIASRFPWRRRQLFGGVSIRSLTQIRSAFREQWEKRFGKVPTLFQPY